MYLDHLDDPDYESLLQPPFFELYFGYICCEGCLRIGLRDKPFHHDPDCPHKGKQPVWSDEEPPDEEDDE